MRLRTVAAALTLLVGSAGCAADARPDAADGGDQAVLGSAPASAAPSPDVADPEGEDLRATGGEQVPHARLAPLWWTAETVDEGRTFSAADLRGEKVVLWMWAPWCSVCNREAPEVAEALADLPEDVTVIGVAGRDDVGPMRDFVARHGLDDMPHVVDADGSLWASYGISYQPAWVFIDGDGNASVAAGALGYDGLLAGVDEVFGG